MIASCGPAFAVRHRAGKARAGNASNVRVWLMSISPWHHCRQPRGTPEPVGERSTSPGEDAYVLRRSPQNASLLSVRMVP
jgi:hypothetical protein